MVSETPESSGAMVSQAQKSSHFFSRDVTGIGLECAGAITLRPLKCAEMIFLLTSDVTRQSCKEGLCGKCKLKKASR